MAKKQASEKTQESSSTEEFERVVNRLLNTPHTPHVEKAAAKPKKKAEKPK
jgi:hypothetical protein